MGRWFEVETFRVGVAGEHTVALLFRDVTQRIHAEQELKEAKRAAPVLQPFDPAGLTREVALTHQEAAGALRLSPEDSSHPELELTVTDSGVGIPAERLATVSEPFAQADSSSSREFGSTGLGLMIARKTIERMHGTIEVESTPGAGSTCRIRLTVTLPEPD